MAEFSSKRIYIRQNLQQCISVQFGFHNSLDHLVKLGTLYLLCFFYIFDILAFFVNLRKHITVAENLTFQCLYDRSYMCVLLQACLIQIDEP